ncbi:hypothetical protein E4T44_02103 [Aureobasidium sp. EXF-8845]|nr:hypothetical protein E4T44_02103 [Aureobasidium sp. EXF-8845]KAI4855699.1 hypothetical protein E4T45_02854 [Aureobasidium sp. EXF-8846]
MAPSPFNNSDEMCSQRARSKSDADIDYSSQEFSSEHLSSGSQSEPLVEDSSTGGLCAVAYDGTHDPAGQSTEQHEEAGLEVVAYADRAPLSKQTWFKGTLVTAENAQALFSPSACIFVANLDRTRSGLDLTEAVKDAFAEIGPCWVKVRFDRKNIPAAFVQFQTDEEAAKANALLHGTRIFGRPCRIKNARAPRTVFVSRRDQADLFVPEAKYHLEQYGKIEHFWTPSHTERAMYNLPAGAFMRFELFQSCQIASRALRNHETLVFTLAQTEKRQPAPTSYNTILPEIVPNAIYVGDLPYDIDQNTLLLIFSHYGRISTVEVRKTQKKELAYAFIYFEKDDAAVMACQYPLIFVRENHRVRVQPKRTKYMRRIAQPQIHNIFRDTSGDTLFFPPGPQYTYRPGNPSCTPRFTRWNWPRY